VRDLIKMAQENGKSQKTIMSRNRSSLHQVIKTKEQAALFMKLLKSS
jgi:hypothetical protein